MHREVLHKVRMRRESHITELHFMCLVEATRPLNLVHLLVEE